LQAQRQFAWGDYVAGWERILTGAVKKFFIADILLRGLTPGFIPLAVIDPLYAWFQLYVYAFYLYCDFSGFVDIAIGTARLVSFRLPENFDRPYTRGSLAQFWQSWHITLSGWLRAYVFLPLMRSLLRTKLKRNVLFITLVVNLVTMSLIGLWHGFTLNFLAWGIWHAVGLFIHKVFSDRTRRSQMSWKNTWRSAAFHVFSVALTFHFVVAGWVFFALPSFEESLRYLALLAGIRL
jgi:alginate O-acetyltransferase complex protein AlgI